MAYRGDNRKGPDFIDLYPSICFVLFQITSQEQSRRSRSSQKRILVQPGVLLVQEVPTIP